MGSVVSFRPRAAEARQMRSRAGTAALIIIFPGVRYERDLADAPRARRGVMLRRAAERQDAPTPRS